MTLSQKVETNGPKSKYYIFCNFIKIINHTCEHTHTGEMSYPKPNDHTFHHFLGSSTVWFVSTNIEKMGYILKQKIRLFSISSRLSTMLTWLREIKRARETEREKWNDEKGLPRKAVKAYEP